MTKISSKKRISVDKFCSLRKATKDSISLVSKIISFQINMLKKQQQCCKK